MIMAKFLYPKHPLRCLICGQSSSGKSVFLASLILNIINEDIKNQDIYQKLIKCFSKYIPLHIKPNISNEEDIVVVF